MESVSRGYLSTGGKRKCKYYSACGNTDNCKRCKSFEKRENK